MIDNVDPKENLDEGVRCIINHLRELEKNLVMYDFNINKGQSRIKLMMKNY